MKTSIFTLVLKDMPLEEVIPLVAKIGYEGIELRGLKPHLPPNTSIKCAKEIKKLIDKVGLKVSCLATYTGGYCRMNDREAEKQIQELKKFIRLACLLDCELIRHGVDGPSYTLGKVKERDWKRGAFWMQKAADLAHKYNKKLVMELHHGGLVETAESAYRLLEMINRDNVGVIHDAGNMYITDTDFGKKSVEFLKGKIFHVHVKDELRVKDQSDPSSFSITTRHGKEIFIATLLGKGGVDHLPAFKALAEIGYNGYLSAECHMTKGIDSRAVAMYEYKELKRLIKLAKR